VQQNDEQNCKEVSNQERYKPEKVECGRARRWQSNEKTSQEEGEACNK
jgi:hypothetical protein